MSEEMDFAMMKVADLKKELKARGLTTTGNKNELMERLQLAVMSNESDILADDDEDILNDSSVKAVKLARPAMAVGHAGAAAGDSPTKKVAIKRDVVAVPSSTADGNVQASPDSGAPPAKRAAISITSATTDGIKTTVAVVKPADGAPATATAAAAAPAEPVKTLSAEEKAAKAALDDERAKSRAARFGVVAPDVKMKARADRFGLPSTKIGESPAVDVDTLKKRSDRFGQASSTVLKKIELDEKIQQRQSRFGVVAKSANGAAAVEAAPKVNVNVGTNSFVVDEKMKKRAERFGTKA